MSYKSIYWEEVEEGQELPELVKEVTATTIVAGAIASRDFNPCHHDKDFVTAQGSPDIFLSIVNTGGWIGKFLTDWGGPEADIKKMDLWLGAQCNPGHTLTLKAKVVKKYVEDGKNLIDLQYEALVPFGTHSKGGATLALPSKS